MRRISAIHLAAVLGFVAVTAPPAGAHHAYATFFDMCTSRTIEGSLERVEWKSPHVWLYVATDAGPSYRAEWTSPRALERDGLSSNTLKPGERVVITGSPMRDPSVVRLTVPDFKGEFASSTVSALTQVGRPADTFNWFRTVQRPAGCPDK
jgi:hypothetical protein